MRIMILLVGVISIVIGGWNLFAGETRQSDIPTWSIHIALDEHEQDIAPDIHAALVDALQTSYSSESAKYRHARSRANTASALLMAMGGAIVAFSVFDMIMPPKAR